MRRRNIEFAHRDNLLIPKAFDVTVTRTDRGVFGSPGRPMGAPEPSYNGPIVTNDIPFRLTANVPYNIVVSNKRRRGLILYNADPVDNLFFAFGKQANELSTACEPGEKVLLDFTCPTDGVWLFATVDLAGTFMEFSATVG